jgi:hypothetical protein
MTEADLLVSLLEWLRARGRIKPDSILVEEFSWYGRWVDLALMTGSGRLTSFELKLHDSRRAILQATYNRLAFDQSYVVTPALPTQDMVALAADVGVGIIRLTPEGGRIILTSPRGKAPDYLRRRLLTQLRSRSAEAINV